MFVFSQVLGVQCPSWGANSKTTGTKEESGVCAFRIIKGTKKRDCLFKKRSCDWKKQTKKEPAVFLRDSLKKKKCN